MWTLILFEGLYLLGFPWFFRIWLFSVKNLRTHFFLKRTMLRRRGRKRNHAFHIFRSKDSPTSSWSFSLFFYFFYFGNFSNRWFIYDLLLLLRFFLSFFMVFPGYTAINLFFKHLQLYSFDFFIIFFFFDSLIGSMMKSGLGLWNYLTNWDIFSGSFCLNFKFSCCYLTCKNMFKELSVQEIT